MIRQFCPACGNEFSVPDRSAGRTTRCLKCGAALVVSADARSSSSGARPAPAMQASQTPSVPLTNPQKQRSENPEDAQPAATEEEGNPFPNLILEEGDPLLNRIGLPIYKRPLAWVLCMLEKTVGLAVSLVRALIKPWRLPRYLVDYVLDSCAFSGVFWRLFFVPTKNPKNRAHSWLITSANTAATLGFPIVILALVITVLTGDISAFPRAVRATIWGHSGGFPYGPYILALFVFLSSVALPLVVIQTPWLRFGEAVEDQAVRVGAKRLLFVLALVALPAFALFPLGFILFHLSSTAKTTLKEGIIGIMGLIAILIAIGMLADTISGIRDVFSGTGTGDEEMDPATIDHMSGLDFEHYVCGTLKRQGFHAHVTPGSGDHGADVIASMGAEKYAVQVKKTSSQAISRSAVSDAVGAMKVYGCNRAMVVTNGSFSEGAIKVARANDCVLVDGRKLKKW